MVIVPIPVEAKLQVSENQTMKYMDVATASEKWGITGRRIRILCNDGRIDGAVRNGWTWQIPEDTPKPGDGRVLRKFRNLDIRPALWMWRLWRRRPWPFLLNPPPLPSSHPFLPQYPFSFQPWGRMYRPGMWLLCFQESFPTP